MLPIIDIADLSSPLPARRAAVAARIGAACRKHGFFYVVGHGVAPDLTAAVLEQAAAFFALPLEEKRLVDKALSSANRGYEGVGGQTLEPGAKPDLKEGYYIGRDLGPDDPSVRAGRFNHGANAWPRRPGRFRPTMEAYYEVMLVLAERVMGGVALSLDLPGDYFTDFCRAPLALLRLLHYPPQAPRAVDRRGAGAHTDFGGLTLLLQDERGGLEVHDQATGGWIAAPPVAGAYVVNLGDMIQRWTNGRYRSTLHRVTNRSGLERYSAPFFFSGAPGYEVACLPGCRDEGETPPPPITVEAHMREMYRRTYAPGPAV